MAIEVNSAKTVYSNQVGIAVNFLEVALLFALDSPTFSEDSGESKLANRSIVADVRLPPALAKRLFVQLEASIKTYEERYGKINLDVIAQEPQNE